MLDRLILSRHLDGVFARWWLWCIAALVFGCLFAASVGASDPVAAWGWASVAKPTQNSEPLAPRRYVVDGCGCAGLVEPGYWACYCPPKALVRNHPELWCGDPVCGTEAMARPRGIGLLVRVNTPTVDLVESDCPSGVCTVGVPSSSVGAGLFAGRWRERRGLFTGRWRERRAAWSGFGAGCPACIK